MNNIPRTKFDPKEKRKFISFCKTRFAGNRNELKMIHEFKHEYTSEKALLWYLQQSFLYEILTEALRDVNVHQLLLLRFFIRDMYEQIKKNQCALPIRAYFGQVMPLYALQDLQQSINGYISINTFLSATTNRNVISNFFRESHSDKHNCKVLFIIDASPDKVTTKPFANISKFNTFMHEPEILFMIGSIFRLRRIQQDEHISMVGLQLCNDNEHDLKPIFENVKKIQGGRNGDEDYEIDLQSFGDMLYRMGKVDLAETIYRHLLNEISSNDTALSNVYRAIGTVSKKKQEYESSLKWYHKSLSIEKQTKPPDFVTLCKLYGYIGEIHLLKKDDSQALSFYNKAVNAFEAVHIEDNPHMANLFNNIASIYRREKKYLKALEFYKKTLAIDDQYPNTHRHNVAKSHNDIGITYCHLEQYDLAIQHYQLALSIELEVVSPQHHSIGHLYKNMSLAYEMKGDFQQAAIYDEKASTIFHHQLLSEDPDVIQIDDNVKSALVKLN